MMKHISMTYLLILCLLGTFLLPLGVFALQDLFDFQNHQMIETNQEVFMKYPIISRIYAATYEHENPSTIASFDLSDLNQYEETTQDQILETKAVFTEQLKELIDHNIIAPSYLENEAETVELSFGYLTNLMEDSSLTMNVHQVFSIEQAYVNSQEFTYLKQADKIIRFQILNDHIPSLSDEEKQAIAWAMITYLGLSELDDWTYLDHGYESYQAKLQVYCQIDTRTNSYYELQVGVQPLGQTTSPTGLFIERF